MSKVYRNQKTGLQFASGVIKSISDDRAVMIIESSEYDRQNKTNKPIEIKAVSMIPFEDSYRVGYDVMAVGYQQGPNTIGAQAVLTGNAMFENEQLTAISGYVRFARLNEEKNADGTQKVKADGVTPRKPHFDITVSVKDEDGRYVNHIIKVYDSPNAEAGQKTNIQRAQAQFGKFDRDTNPIKVHVITQPGVVRSYTNTKDGKEYVNYTCDHVGYSSMDIEYVEPREKTKDAPQTTRQSTPAQTAPTQTVAQGGNGVSAQFDPNLAMEDDEMEFQG